MTETPFRPQTTPGDLARSAMYDDPDAMADALIVWHGLDDRGRLNCAAWLRRVADGLDPGRVGPL